MLSNEVDKERGVHCVTVGVGLCLVGCSKARLESISKGPIALSERTKSADKQFSTPQHVAHASLLISA